MGRLQTHEVLFLCFVAKYNNTTASAANMHTSTEVGSTKGGGRKIKSQGG